jgi:hypothetical protein
MRIVRQQGVDVGMAHFMFANLNNPCSGPEDKRRLCADAVDAELHIGPQDSRVQ